MLCWPGNKPIHLYQTTNFRHAVERHSPNINFFLYSRSYIFSNLVQSVHLKQGLSCEPCAQPYHKHCMQLLFKNKILQLLTSYFATLFPHKHKQYNPFCTTAQNLQGCIFSLFQLLLVKPVWGHAEPLCLHVHNECFNACKQEGEWASRKPKTLSSSNLQFRIESKIFFKDIRAI